MVTAYLDNSATTRPAPAVVSAIRRALEEGFYNPSSLYMPGVEARKEMDACRGALKGALGAHRVVFTSGGTEADNLAILGRMAKARRRGRVLYSRAEHPAVVQACKTLSLSHDVLEIPLTAEGVLDLEAFSRLMTPEVQLICVMQVSNEIGAIQPLNEVCALRDRLCPDAAVHVDGVQGFLRIPFNLTGERDSYAVSAHKIHGPKGVGALAMGKGVRLAALVQGGGQEEGLRSGTENTPGIAGFHAAIENYPAAHAMRALKLRLLEKLREGIPEVAVNGPDPAGPSACGHILNLSFPPVRAQTMMHALEGEGVIVSHGAACSSRRRSPSATLTGMGLPKVRQDSALRFSLSPYTTESEIDAAVSACVSNYRNLKPYTRR